MAKLATRIGATFGRMWRNMIRRRPMPNDRSASMYGSGFCSSVDPRTMRMSPCTLKIASSRIAIA